MEPLREDDPERIGGHRLFALLGEGGWGSVYFARSSDSGRGLALKTIRPKWLDEHPERFRSRFAREVEAARAVDPRHTAEVVHYDTRAPEPWFATRYIAGVNLREALDHCGSPLPLRTWRMLAAGLTDAVRSIHSAKLVHRDLKLDNILLAAEGASVIDFGIARHLSPEDGVTLTGTAGNPRTTSFASPEQLRDERVGPASDVFALGLVLAYTALHRHPFGTGSPMQIGSNILHGRLSLDGLSPVVERVVRPCLEAKPQNRPRPAEIAELLAADASPKAKEWLPPGLRAKIDQRSRFAIDIDRPLRPRRGGGQGGPAPARSTSASGLTSDPTPAESRAAPSARKQRERDLSSARPDRAGTDTTTLPPPVAPRVNTPAKAVRQSGAPDSAPAKAMSRAGADDGARDGAVRQAAAEDNARSKNPPQAAAPDVDAQLRASAEAGNAEAMRWLAARYKSAQDLNSALLWYQRAADSGNPTGAREAGQLLERYFPERRAQALALYRMAADAGEVFAKTRLEELQGQKQAGRPADAPRRNEKAPAKTVPAAEQALLREHRAAAMEGRIGSMLALADWYMQQKRDQDALVWFWRAAEAGHPHSMLATAQLLAKDARRNGDALHWFRKAAAAGNTEALYQLGRRMAQEGNQAAALGYFRGAGDKGHMNSMVEAARVLEQTGQLQQALDWFTRAAEKGSPSAPKDAERLRADLRRVSTPPPQPKASPPPKKTGAGTKGGGTSVTSLRKQAALHEKEGRLSKALSTYAQAEQLGDVASQRDVARLCLQLRDRTADAEERRRLKKRAVRLYRKLAEDGDARSVKALAELDAEGGRQAQTQFQSQVQAAEAGSTKAMRTVARTLLNSGSEEDAERALAWLRQAGEQRNTGAMLDGARVLEERGRYREAMEWYAWAREHGDRTAAAHIERLAAEHPGTALLHRLKRWRLSWS
ncbi:protein kinase [Streptomyces sp. NPDC049687]|uniref:protein kinase domain-containing protein n=1 Tax=Streptomyces sp. NPDC049687 TaxID=3365596 RepID=UPI0037A19513